MPNVSKEFIESMANIPKPKSPRSPMSEKAKESQRLAADRRREIDAPYVKRKSCTVDGIAIFPSCTALGKILGHAKEGIRNPNFRYVEESANMSLKDINELPARTRKKIPMIGGMTIEETVKMLMLNFKAKYERCQ